MVRCLTTWACNRTVRRPTSALHSMMRLFSWLLTPHAER